MGEGGGGPVGKMDESERQREQKYYGGCWSFNLPKIQWIEKITRSLYVHKFTQESHGETLDHSKLADIDDNANWLGKIVAFS